MNIAFDSEAGDSFADLANRLRGYHVRVTPHDDENRDPFEALLIGTGAADDETRAGWVDVMRVAPGDEDGNIGATLTLRVEELLVY